MMIESRLKKVLTTGRFAVTAECGPPKGADPEAVRKKGLLLKGFVDSVNVTDNQTGVVRLSSLASCAILRQEGLDPVLQMVTRDRNRIALQSDVLGASALGIRNILCLSGDHQALGNQPEAKGVFDLDSIQLLKVVREMRDSGVILGGDQLSSAPDLFIGAVENPFGDPMNYAYGEARKEGARRGRVHPDPVRLQPRPLQGVHGGSDGQGPRGESRDPRRRYPA